MNDENLIPYKKGERTPEQAAAAGRLGGIASGKVRREKATFKKALEKALNGKPGGKLKDALIQVGYDPGEMSNADALMSTLMSMALQGNIKAIELLLNYQFQLSEDERKTNESSARISAMGQNQGSVQVESSDDDDGGVVIYLPKIDDDPEETEDGEDAGEAPEGVME